MLLKLNKQPVLYGLNWYFYIFVYYFKREKKDGTHYTTQYDEIVINTEKGI